MNRIEAIRADIEDLEQRTDLSKERKAEILGQLYALLHKEQEAQAVFKIGINAEGFPNQEDED
jgi:hypothetical protein